MSLAAVPKLQPETPGDRAARLRQQAQYASLEIVDGILGAAAALVMEIETVDGVPHGLRDELRRMMEDIARRLPTCQALRQNATR